MLPVVILLALKRFEIEEISHWWLSSCVSWTCIQGVGEDRGIAIAWTFLMGLWLGSSNVEKCGDHWRKKFFINNPVEALIPFKEKHQGLLKLHVPLGWDWGKGGGGLSMGKSLNFLWNGKIISEEDSCNLLKSCLSFGGCLESKKKKKRGGNRKKRFYCEK